MKKCIAEHFVKPSFYQRLFKIAHNFYFERNQNESGQFEDLSIRFSCRISMREGNDDDPKILQFDFEGIFEGRDFIAQVNIEKSLLTGCTTSEYDKTLSETRVTSMIDGLPFLTEEQLAWN